MARQPGNHGVKWGGVDSSPQVFGAKNTNQKQRGTRKRIHLTGKSKGKLCIYGNIKY